MPTIGLFITVLSLLFSVQALGSVLGQNLLDGFQTLFGNVVEGSAALADVVALQGHNVGKCRAPFNYVPEEGLEAIKKVLAENAAKGLN